MAEELQPVLEAIALQLNDIRKVLESIACDARGFGLHRVLQEGGECRDGDQRPSNGCESEGGSSG